MDIFGFDEKTIFDLQRLEDIRKRPDILERIRLDVTPQMVMEPRFTSRPGDVEKTREISGYMFYIETMTQRPELMLMKVGKGAITSTVGKIDEIPREMIQKAMESPVHPPVNGMYAITGEIREWLRSALNPVD